MKHLTRDSKWCTFYGKSIKISELSHQHLSNILYYFELVLEMKVTLLIEAELYQRFGGIKLPYHPLISFDYEIKELVKKGYTTGEPNADVVVNGKWVGKILYN